MKFKEYCRIHNPLAFQSLVVSKNAFYIIREYWICMNYIAMEENNDNTKSNCVCDK